MEQIYETILQEGKRIFHGSYCLYKGFSLRKYNTPFHTQQERHPQTAYDRGEILCIFCHPHIGADADVEVFFRNGESYTWKSKHINAYNAVQFGLAVSVDGKYVFVQTWENGLFCLDPRTGETLWRTKSRRGITNIFVNENTVLCQQHEYAMQLLDIHTGQVLKEKRPSTAWGFQSIDHQHILIQATARRWELIDAQTMEVKETWSHKDFTGGHTQYCINKIGREGNKIRIGGFRNVFDNSVKPPRRLPNLEFEHTFPSKYLTELEQSV